MTRRKTRRVCNATGRSIHVRGHGPVRPGQDAQAVPNTPQVDWLIAEGALSELSPPTPTPTPTPPAASGSGDPPQTTPEPAASGSGDPPQTTPEEATQS